MGNPYQGIRTPFGVTESPVTQDAEPHGPAVAPGTSDVIQDPVEVDHHQIPFGNSRVAEHPEPILAEQPAYEFDVPRHLE